MNDDLLFLLLVVVPWTFLTGLVVIGLSLFFYGLIKTLSKPGRPNAR